MKEKLGHLVPGRKILSSDAGCELREQVSSYNAGFAYENGGLRAENLFNWEEITDFPVP